jgi:hypothetical protein
MNSIQPPTRNARGGLITHRLIARPVNAGNNADGHPRRGWLIFRTADGECLGCVVDRAPYGEFNLTRAFGLASADELHDQVYVDLSEPARVTVDEWRSLPPYRSENQ